MTRDEIMELEGESLDMAVAEHVFGWHWEETDEKGDKELVGDTVLWQGMEWLRTYRPGHHRYKFYPNKYIGDPTEMPAYSGNIMDADLVYEKMMAKYHWQVYSPFTAEDVLHVAGLTPLGVTGWNGRPDYQAYGDTLPIAICRAALVAIFEDVDDESD